MPDFSIPLSGLTAESAALSAIANNLSNQNTTGYKDTTVLFSDLFSRVWEPRGREILFRWGLAWRLVPCPHCSPKAASVPRACTRMWPSKATDFLQYNADGTIDYTRAGRFFGRLQQLPGHFRRTTSPGLSRGERSRQYRRGDRAVANRRGYVSADGNRQRRDNRQS